MIIHVSLLVFFEKLNILCLAIDGLDIFQLSDVYHPYKKSLDFPGKSREKGWKFFQAFLGFHGFLKAEKKGKNPGPFPGSFSRLSRLGRKSFQDFYFAENPWKTRERLERQENHDA